MTEEPGRPPEERLPAPRPPSAPVSADRFSAPPSAHRNDLTPERAGRIVRQSANARWVGFLAVTIVGLFVIGYYFYELGLPGGIGPTPQLQAAGRRSSRSPRSSAATTCTRPTAPSATGSTARAARVPTLNSQDKLFAHLNPDYLRNMLTAGGRYACGNPLSIMPVWSNTGNPPGPLNYKQIDYLIAFLRASKNDTYRVLDPALAEPVDRPGDGQGEDVHGLERPRLQAGSRGHAVPGLLGRRSSPRRTRRPAPRPPAPRPAPRRPRPARRSRRPRSTSRS